MSHEMIGQATVDHKVTSIRKYNNAIYTVEADGKTLYWSQDFEDFKKKLDKDGVSYSFDK